MVFFIVGGHHLQYYKNTKQNKHHNTFIYIKDFKKKNYILDITRRRERSTIYIFPKEHRITRNYINIHTNSSFAFSYINIIAKRIFST